MDTRRGGEDDALHALAEPRETVGQSAEQRRARAVDDVVSFKVWPADEPEPGWAAWDYVRAVRLPPGWLAAGNPGWYVGHLQPGDAIRYRDLFIEAMTSQASASSRSAMGGIVPADPQPVPGLP